MTLYSKQIDRYLNYTQTGLILPDKVLRREGVSCGDALDLAGENNEGIVSFHMISRGCVLSKASCNYLHETFCGKPLQSATQRCHELSTSIKQNPSFFLAFWGLDGQYELLECLASPVEVLYEFLCQMSNSGELSYQRADTLHNLDCDACVSSARINWTGKQENVVRSSMPKSYATEFRKKWAIASKLYLNPKERLDLFDLYKDMRQEDFDFLVHEKMLWSVYANMEQNGVQISGDERFKKFIYPLHRQYIVKRELEQIQNYISDNELPAYFVKGTRSADLYQPSQYRLHLDHDIICITENAAFTLCNYLYRRGFRLFSGVFSLKWINEADGRTCSGHYHLQKILDAQYQIIIDVTFPAFPMGRISLFHPSITERGLRLEDLLLVAICHTFKHRNVFMKDINDVYMMLKVKNLDLLYLSERIHECRLHQEASLLISYIYENYDLSEAQKIAIQSGLNLDFTVLSRYPDWPYNESSVYQIKRDDLDSRLHSGDDMPRIYLFPIAVSVELLDLATLQTCAELEVEHYSNSVRRVLCQEIEFYVFPMGIFMDADFGVSKFGREAVRSAATTLLEVMGQPETYELPYATRMRDNWYD